MGVGSSAKSKGLTAADFFLRFPDLCPFLLARLDQATAALAPDSPAGPGPARPEGGREDGEQRLHPELQPVLVLLAQVPRPGSGP